MVCRLARCVARVYYSINKVRVACCPMLYLLARAGLALTHTQVSYHEFYCEPRTMFRTRDGASQNAEGVVVVPICNRYIRTIRGLETMHG